MGEYPYAMQAGSLADEIVYSQNFNSDSADEWRLQEGWAIVPSENGKALYGSGHVWADLIGKTWDDYYLQFRMNSQSSAVMHANIRLLGTVRYFIGLSRNQSYLSRQDDQNTIHDGLATGRGIGSGWHQIRITVVGGKIEVLCDNRRLFVYTDPNPLTSGGVAFENLTEAATLVDDVIVGIPTQAITPAASAGKTVVAPPNTLKWINTGGPLGGLGYDIRMSPENPDVMYVTDAKAGVFKSIDGGHTWKAINKGISIRAGETGDQIPIFCLTISPTNPDLIWAGTTGQRGAFKSTDAGETWHKMDNGIKFPTLTLRGFAIDPGDNNIVYTAGELSSWEWSGSEQFGGKFDKVKGVVYKTTNGGQLWKEIWRGNNLGRYILIDPRNSNVLYLSTGIFDREAADSDFKTGKQGGEGILKSTDGGQTWHAINNGLKNLYVGSLVMHPTNPDILLAGVGNNTFTEGSGVYITKNGGESWTQTLQLYAVTSVEISAANPNRAYAGNFTEFYRSDDGGMNWIQVNKASEGWGPPGLLGGQPIDFQADPRDPDRLFANAYGGGNFITEDAGRTWKDTSNGYTGSMIRDIAVDPTSPGHVYAVGRSGFFESRNGGSNWDTPNRSFRNNDYHVIALNPSNPSQLVAELNCGRALLYSPDGGRTFTQTYSSPEDNFAWRTLAFAPSDPSVVYAGGIGYQSCGISEPQFEAKGFLRSTDGGLSWADANDAITKNAVVMQIAIHPNKPLTAYAATFNHGLLQTTDGGKTWTNPGKEFSSSTRSTAVEISPADPSVIFAAKYHAGLWVSTDAGINWKRSSNGLISEAFLTDIVFDPIQPQVMYVSDLFSGVYRSVDGGKNWKVINTGLLNRAVNKMSLSSDGLHLYAATEGMGVFRLDLNNQPPASIPERTDDVSIESSGTQNSDTPIQSDSSAVLEQSTENNAPSTHKKVDVNDLFAGCSTIPAVMIFTIPLVKNKRKHHP